MVELVSLLELSGGVPDELETVETAGGSMVSEQDLLDRVGGQKKIDFQRMNAMTKGVGHNWTV